MGFLIGLKSYICLIDIFGQGIQLKIDKNTKSKTIFGGIMSIFMIVLLSVFFYFNAQDVLYKTNPQISVEQQINSNSPDLILDQSSFPISFSLTNYGNYRVFNPKYFTYSLVYSFGETSAEYTEDVHLNMTQCTKDYFPNIPEQKFFDQQLDKNLCIENQNVSLLGSWQGGSLYIKFMKISISMCQGKEDCAPYEEINDYINSNVLFWNLYYQNTNINPQNADQPISYNIVNYYKALKSETRKFTEINLRRQKLQSEEGFLFQSTNIMESIAYDYEWADVGSLDDSKTLIEFAIFASQNTYIYHRAYMKIQTAIANVGGMANVIRVAFVIICYIFSIIKRDEIILNRLFDFDLNSKSKNTRKRSTDLKFENLSETKLSKSRANIKNYYSKINPKIDCVSNIELQSNVNSPEKNYKKDDTINSNKKTGEKDEISRKVKRTMTILQRRSKKYQLSFSFVEIIFAFLLCSCFRSRKLNTKRKLYDLSNFAVDEFLDISYIIQKLEEFEKFKLVVLDPQQIALFDFISKELISLDDERIKNHDMTRMKNFNKNKEELAKIILNYQEKIKGEASVIGSTDRKLFGLLNEELQQK
jgi:hypothetical protein